MSRQDVERLEAAAGYLLDELGYERAVPNPVAETLEHAATIREAFSQDLRRRGQRSAPSYILSSDSLRTSLLLSAGSAAVR
jgi:hypothetical protein